ncbi:hypothetical protein RCG23_00185 [Neobacillus sp. PS3-34]|uniref:hypothetical protein n=1 Tax=Neobacillus sp. PS3-34 TaxID=3070678 RepID=UPI0027E10031|nr:hypothetical protein [Neobacillus sp. PS3-34]WML48612.1 hypothetical protein RCG23_00185 [Neobacillus sp. PS3-34]
MGLILGIFIGLVTGVLLGTAISFPVGSAVGIFIDRNFTDWAIEIEIALIILCSFIIFKFFNARLKKC